MNENKRLILMLIAMVLGIAIIILVMKQHWETEQIQHTYDKYMTHWLNVSVQNPNNGDSIHQVRQIWVCTTCGDIKVSREVQPLSVLIYGRETMPVFEFGSQLSKQIEEE